MTNTFKENIKNLRLQHGLWVTMSDKLAVEMMAGAGYDWMMFDTEHSPIDPVSMLPLLQIADGKNANAVVRPTSLNVPDIKKFLDLGARNVLVPMINNSAEAELAVAAVEYPPSGVRGVSGMSRATNFGRTKDYHKMPARTSPFWSKWKPPRPWTISKLLQMFPELTGFL